MTPKYPQITHVVNKFFKDSQAEVEGRYQSWNYCYEHFRKLFKHATLTQDDIDRAALMLGFYLASWGMYRGSSFLLKDYTYTVHKKAVNILFEYKDFFTKRIIKEDEIKELFDLYDKLEEHYKKLKISVSKGPQVAISQTLITKIIMGVFGIIPAYDRNVKKALSVLGISQILNEKGYTQLLKFFYKNKEEFLSLSSNEYPPMKILDVYLWKWGQQLLDNKNGK